MPKPQRWNSLGAADGITLRRATIDDAGALSEAAAAAREFSGIGMWLAVWEQNPRAIAFYLKHGFTPVGRQAFRVGSEVQSDLVLCSPGLAS